VRSVYPPSQQIRVRFNAGLREIGILAAGMESLEREPVRCRMLGRNNYTLLGRYI